MAKGETTIVFLRDNNNIDTPLITIEIRNGIIRQCYGYHDSFNHDPLIKEFIERYAKEKGWEIQACIFRNKEDDRRYVA